MAISGDQNRSVSDRRVFPFSFRRLQFHTTLLPATRRHRYEPGKKVRSAVRIKIKNRSNSDVAFKKLEDEKKIRLLVHTGGRWKDKNTMHLRYEGIGERTYPLEIPLDLNSFSVLMDLVRKAAGLADDEDVGKLTYESGLICFAFGANPGDPPAETGYAPILLARDIHVENFMMSMKSRPQLNHDLYLDDYVYISG